jgi:hypothetical protein
MTNNTDVVPNAAGQKPPFQIKQMKEQKHHPVISMTLPSSQGVPPPVAAENDTQGRATRPGALPHNANVSSYSFSTDDVVGNVEHSSHNGVESQWSTAASLFCVALLLLAVTAGVVLNKKKSRSEKTSQTAFTTATKPRYNTFVHVIIWYLLIFDKNKCEALVAAFDGEGSSSDSSGENTNGHKNESNDNPIRQKQRWKERNKQKDGFAQQTAGPRMRKDRRLASCTTGSNGKSCGSGGSPSGTFSGSDTSTCSCTYPTCSSGGSNCDGDALRKFCVLQSTTSCHGKWSKMAEVKGADNPFDGMNFGNYAAPTSLDMDNDGDLDMVVGNYDGNLAYLKNTGTNTNPVYTQQLGADNPFDGMKFGSYAAPTSLDMDNDGDLDMEVGNSAGNIAN